MKKIKNIINLNSQGSKNKLNLPIWLLFLFSGIEVVAIIQGLLESNQIIMGYGSFVPDSTLILVISVFALVIYLFTIVFFNKHLEKIIKILAIIGAISTFLMLFQNVQIFEICAYINSLISATNIFLILTYISMYFSIKNVVYELLISIFLYKSIAKILNNTIFNIPFYVSIILMLVGYTLFLISFLYFPKHEIKVFKTEVEEEKETNLATPSKQPPYFLYILLIIFLGLISGVEALTNNILIINGFSNLLFLICSIISAIFTFCIILKKGVLKFFDLMYLFLFAFALSLIALLFDNAIIYYIGSALLGLFALPLSITVILSAILFTKTNKITTPIWIICLNTLSLYIWQELLSKVESFNGLIVIIIPIILVTAILLRFLKPHLNFAIQEHNFEIRQKNEQGNPLSYLSEIELNFVILASEGYTFNQITEQLNLTPLKLKEVKFRVYEMLQVKNKKDLVEKVVSYKI